jgi:hypothetical protein
MAPFSWEPLPQLGAGLTENIANEIGRPLLSSNGSGNAGSEVPDIDIMRMPESRLTGKPSKRGKAPTGDDGHPIELHHKDQNPEGPLIEMTRTEHRGKGNFSKNHSNTGQSASEIDRSIFSQQRRNHWQNDYDSGRFDNISE